MTMKNVKRTLSLVLVGALSLMMSVSAFAADASVDTAPSEYEQLKADVQLVQSVELSNVQEFAAENKDWLENLDARIEEYLSGYPESKHDSILTDLRGDGNARSAYDYFDSYTYGLRNGYYTYSMVPKMTTRLLRSYAEAGWEELSNIYYYIENDTGSLYWQYMCHFDLFVEADWDIERGVPEVSSYAEMLTRLCNPQYNDGYID